MSNIQITAKEKIALHLLNYFEIDDLSELPLAVSQEGIASAIGIEQKHVPRVLKKLKEDEYIHEEKAHVGGTKQKRNT